MSEVNSFRRIVRAARDLSQIEPDAHDVDAAMRAARKRLARGRAAASWVVTVGGVAAVVVAAITLAIIAALPRDAAAANLEKAARATQKYKGWVHLRPQPVDEPATAATTTASSKPSIRERDVVIHFNTVDGTLAAQFELNGIRCALLVDPARHEQRMYASAVRMIRVDDVTKQSGDAWYRRAAEAPLELADLLAAMKKDGVAPPPRVTESRDGELSRFELAFASDSKKSPERYREMMAGPITVWTNPHNGLIRRMRSLSHGRMLLVDFTYGEPPIRDIYDLGVPRDAMVIDARERDRDKPTTVASTPATRPAIPDPSVDLKAVAARINGRFDKGFGDHVALLCEETVLRPDQPALRREGKITLYGREGDRALASYHLVAPAGVFVGLLGFPPGWPAPKLADALPMLQRSTPAHEYVTDGKTLWHASIEKPAKVEVIKTFEVPPARMVEDVAAQVWPRLPSDAPPALGKVNIVFAESKLEAVRDPGQPALLGLRVSQDVKLPINGKERHHRQETVYWIDSARDDMPVETVLRFNSPMTDEDEKDTRFTEIRKLYDDDAKLPDGRWYPTTWRSEQTRPDLPPAQRVVRHTYRLQIFPNEKLDEKWYADPSRRFKSSADK